MKKLAIALCLAITFAVPAWSQSCPHPNTQLSAGTNSKSLSSNGRQSVGSFSAELWADGRGTMNMTAYGDPGGGSAFKANWGNAGDFLARVGYYWGNGQKFTSYNNICADYNYTKTGTAGGYNYIGVYGWTKSPTIEYYIVDDWWGDNRGIGDIEGQIKGGGSNFSKKGSFEVDGGTYNVYQNQRNNAASINGNETFQQYFSVRTTGRRTCGTISVTEHFKKWASLNMNMGNMYEASITVEAGGGTGSIDYRYGKMSQVTGACGGGTTPAPTPSSSSVAPSSSSRPSSSSVAPSSSSRPSSSSVAVSSSSSRASSSSAVSSSATAASSSSRASSSSATAASSSSRANSSSAGNATPVLGNRVPVTYFSIQPQSDKALRIEISSPAVVEIFDLKGKKVEKFEVSSTLQTVSLSSPNGVYFAKVHGMKSIRFVLK